MQGIMPRVYNLRRDGNSFSIELFDKKYVEIDGKQEVERTTTKYELGTFEFENNPAGFKYLKWETLDPLTLKIMKEHESKQTL